MGDITLGTDDLVLTLRPDWGGRVRSLYWRGQPVLFPLQGANGDFDGRLWPKGGAYPLFPFHNRIPQGRFQFDRTVTLPLHPHEPNAVHGHSHQRPWQVAAQDGAMIELRYDDPGLNGWPWPFTASQRFVLRPDGLDLLLSIANRSGGTMPAGMGWHPFFAKGAIATDAVREWAMGGDLLPTGAWWPAPAQGAPTRYLSDWRRADLILPGMRVVLRAASLPHLVIHDPVGDYTCVEPVSHLANSMNLHPERTTDNLAELAPGQVLEGRLSLDFSPWPSR